MLKLFDARLFENNLYNYFIIITKENNLLDVSDVDVSIRAACYKNSCSFMHRVNE